MWYKVYLIYQKYTSFNNDMLCFRPAPKDEDEMMVAIFECIDRLFGIVRPRKVGKPLKQIQS